MCVHSHCKHLCCTNSFTHIRNAWHARIAPDSMLSPKINGRFCDAYVRMRSFCIVFLSSLPRPFGSHMLCVLYCVPHDACTSRSVARPPRLTATHSTFVPISYFRRAFAVHDIVDRTLCIPFGAEFLCKCCAMQQHATPFLLWLWL